MGPKEYAVLVTDKRSIFVLESSSKAGIAGALGGVIGAAVAQAATSRRTFDYENSEPDALANDPKNFTIPHQSLERMEMKKSMLGPLHQFNIHYKTQEGKGKKIKGQLSPPPELFKQRKKEGVSGSTIHHDYATKVQEVYQRALPATTMPALPSGINEKLPSPLNGRRRNADRRNLPSFSIITPFGQPQ